MSSMWGPSDVFGQRPFILGSLIAHRTFNIDTLGRLRSPQYENTIITPGENIASCDRSSYYKKDPDHVATIDCTCGWYCYWDRKSRYTDGKVFAIIEGYGRATVGTKGFRAQKMKVLAIVDDRPPKYEVMVRFGSYIPEWAGWTGLFLGVVALGFFISGFFTFPFWVSVLSMMGMAIGAWTALCRMAYESNEEALGSHTIPQYRRMDLFKRAYPDVKVFRSERAALRHYKVTKPSLSPPEPEATPEDEDFWNRRAAV